MARLRQHNSRPLFAGLAFLAGGLACSGNALDKNVIIQPLIPAATIASYHDMLRAEVFVVMLEGKARKIATIQFFEKRPDLGEIERLKKADWNVRVPEGQSVFIAAAGQRRDAIKSCWVGWNDKTTLNALSLLIEKPVSVAIAPMDRLLGSAVISNRKMRQYFLRPDGEKWQLWLHEFVGEMGRPGFCQTKKVLDLRAEPAAGAVTPVAGPEGDVVVAWAESSKEGFGFSAVLIKGDEPGKVLNSGRISQTKSMERVRLGIYAGPKVPARISCVAQAADGSTYQVVEAVCDFAAGAVKIQAQKLNVPKDSIHSAASFYLKHPEEAQGFTCLLTNEGVFRIAENEELRTIRHGVPLDYEFPIVTTLGARHEAVWNARGEIEMRTIE